MLDLICEGGLVFVLYTSLFRFRLVPRALAGFGQPIVFAMLAPPDIAHLALLNWLLLRGLREVVSLPQMLSGGGA